MTLLESTIALAGAALILVVTEAVLALRESRR